MTIRYYKSDTRFYAVRGWILPQYYTIVHLKDGEWWKHEEPQWKYLVRHPAASKDLRRAQQIDKNELTMHLFELGHTYKLLDRSSNRLGNPGWKSVIPFLPSIIWFIGTAIEVWIKLDLHLPYWYFPVESIPITVLLSIKCLCWLYTVSLGAWLLYYRDVGPLPIEEEA